MAPGRVASRRKLPDEKHLAFAVCIVHSKPKELSIEEYINLLRQHVAKGRRENALSNVYRHLDKSSFWRAEYERVKEALDLADKERLGLRLEVDQLKARGESARPAAPAKKRKRQEDEDVIPVSRSPKKPKEKAAEKHTGLTPDNIDAGFDFSHLGEPGDALIRSFYQVHALLKNHHRTEPALLAQQLIRAANAVSNTLQQIADKTSAGEGRDDDSLRAILTVVSRAMHSLVIGFTRASNVGQASEVQGPIIYAYVQIFEKINAVVGAVARVEAQKAADTVPTQAARPSTSKGKTKKTVDPAPKQQKHESLSALAKVVVGIISLLDAKQESHKLLFEGLAYVVIENLAKCLYALIFGRRRSETIEDEIVAGGHEDVIEESDQPSSCKSDEMDVKTATIEASYLVQVLTRLMQAAPAHFGATAGAKGSKSKAAIKTAPLKDNLAITAKERLQRTLVNCMFGTEGVDEDDPFLDCLRKPALPRSLPSVPAMKEAEVQDWFKEEVWRLLGWDILSREGGI